MATFITKQDIQICLDGINNVLAQRNASYRLALHGRYNYSVIEKVKAMDEYISFGDPLVAGTKRECYNYVCALLRGMYMAQGDD